MSDLEIVRADKSTLDSYVIPTWLNSYALGFVGKLARADGRYSIGRENYWAAQRAKIERILATSTTSVRVAKLDGEPIGWVCDDQTRRRCHYLFVNGIFRKQGVAKALLPEWFHDSTKAVYLTALPPPWYSRRDNSGAPTKWPQHVAIDLISPE